jgi:hypothetical protein
VFFRQARKQITFFRASAYDRGMLAPAYTDTPVLQPAPRNPEGPLRVVVLVRRSKSAGPSTHGIEWLPSESHLGAEGHGFLNHLLVDDSESNRLVRGIYAMVQAARHGAIELGILADCDETLFGPPSNHDDDPISLPTTAALLNSATTRRPVDLLIVPHRQTDRVDPILIETLMRVAHRANVPTAIGVPADALHVLPQAQAYQQLRIRDESGWVALVAGDLISPKHESIEAGLVSAVFALGAAVISSMARLDLPNFIGPVQGIAEGFRACWDTPEAALVFPDDGWVKVAVEGFVPFRGTPKEALYFPAMPMMVDESRAAEPIHHLPWRMLLTRILSNVRRARDELLRDKPHAEVNAIRQTMEEELNTLTATHGALISPPIRSRRPLSDRSAISVECTERGDRVILTVYPHRASTRREMVLRFEALVARRANAS